LHFSGNCGSFAVIVKHKTSVAIDEDLLLKLKREAVHQDRSVSYLLNKLIEEKLSKVHDEPAHYGNRKRKHP
jgi:hypothetical protein